MRKTNSRGLKGIAFGLLLVLTQSALAQSGTTAITGHVKDPQGARLPGATVTLYGRERTFSLTTTTDSTGTYRFDRLAPGEYLVEAEAEGFASASAKQVSVERGQQVTLDIPLELSGVRSTVVVTASDTPQSVDEVSKAVTVVERQEIDERDYSAIASPCAQCRVCECSSLVALALSRRSKHEGCATRTQPC